MNDKKTARKHTSKILEELFKPFEQLTDSEKIDYLQTESKMLKQALDEYDNLFKPKAVEVEKLERFLYEGEMKALQNKVYVGEISFGKMVEILNEKAIKWIQDNCLSQANEVDNEQQFAEQFKVTCENVVPLQCCPMCNGYGQINSQGTTSSPWQQCPACNGNRLIPMHVLSHSHELGKKEVIEKCPVCGNPNNDCSEIF